MKKHLIIPLFILAAFSACTPTDPANDLIQHKTDQLTGVWVWINTKYPTPFGSIVVSSLETGTIYKIVFTGNKGEIFRQNHLVQKITFEVKMGADDDFLLNILSKKELESSSIDMLGGKISLSGRRLTLGYSTSSFESEMLLSKLEIF